MICNHYYIVLLSQKKIQPINNMNNLRNIITSKILSNIQPNVKPIDYLMETLMISRESVYRRIRGDISFTLEEIVSLSTKLGFSIDELIIKDMPSRVFFNLNTDSTHNPSEFFVISCQQHIRNILDINSSREIESIMVINQIPHEFILFYNHLHKFLYYRWMHQFQESSLKYSYSDVTMPEELLNLQHNAKYCLKKIRNNTLILDSRIFINLIREVHYYHKRKLIDEADYLDLKNDLLGLIEKIEIIAQTGFYNSETKYNIYLSSLNVDSGSRFIKYDEQMKSIFFVSSMEPVVVTNTNLCKMHKKWLDSMRKYSTLITQSNEILQVKYFDKQRSNIEELTENSAIFSM